MEHDLQKKQELELWNMVSSGKPRQGAKTPSRTPQRMKQEVPNRNYQTISRSKKQHIVLLFGSTNLMRDVKKVYQDTFS